VVIERFTQVPFFFLAFSAHCKKLRKTGRESLRGYSVPCRYLNAPPSYRLFRRFCSSSDPFPAPLDSTRIPIRNLNLPLTHLLFFRWPEAAPFPFPTPGSHPLTRSESLPRHSACRPSLLSFSRSLRSSYPVSLVVETLGTILYLPSCSISQRLFLCTIPCLQFNRFIFFKRKQTSSLFLILCCVPLDFCFLFLHSLLNFSRL